MAEPAATTKTTTAWIYCQQCGYDLRASAEAGRCPECGRVFSPDDPKSFRERPFRPAWQRAVGRWVKRGAVLLLSLVLALLLLLAASWAWLDWEWNQEQDAVTTLRGHVNTSILWGETGKAWVGRLGSAGFVLERVEKIRLPETLGDADLPALRKLRRLKSLTLACPRVTDAGLVHIAGLTELRDLDLRETQITDAGLIHLTRLTQLEGLSLDKTRITDAGLMELAAHQKLFFLSLADTEITDAGLVHLRAIPMLRILVLRGTRITNAGLVHLEECQGLQRFYLERTRISPAGMECLYNRLVPPDILDGP